MGLAALAPTEPGVHQVLIVIVAGERWAIPAADVVEIVRPRVLTRLPYAPSSLLGLANLRGAVLPVVALAALLGHAVSPARSTSRIVVVDQGPRVGLLVDSVSTLTLASGERQVDLQALLAVEFSGLARRGAAVMAGGERVVAASAGDVGGLALLGFRVAGQEFALPLDCVLQVARLPREWVVVPQSDPAMVGVMAFREALLPLVSFRGLLGFATASVDQSDSRVIAVRTGGAVVGLVADAVTAVMHVAEQAIDALPAVLTRGTAEAQVAAICRLDGGRRLVAVLSPDRLFDDATAARLGTGARDAARSAAETGEAAALEQVVVFQLGDEHYGLPLAAVQEVVRRPGRLASVPHAPEFVEGMMSLRGRIIPVINQRERFAAQGAAPGGSGGRVIVVAIGPLDAGLAVDGVSGVVGIGAADLAAAPSLSAADSVDRPLFDRLATLERHGRSILLLDPQVLLDRTERDLLTALAARAEVAAAS
jgi:purine-binding chemotaxis protein CheW